MRSTPYTFLCLLLGSSVIRSVHSDTYHACDRGEGETNIHGGMGLRGAITTCAASSGTVLHRNNISYLRPCEHMEERSHIDRTVEYDQRDISCAARVRNRPGTNSITNCRSLFDRTNQIPTRPPTPTTKDRATNWTHDSGRK